MSISFDEIFLLVSRYLSLWPWPSLELAIIGSILCFTNTSCFFLYTKYVQLFSNPLLSKVYCTLYIDLKWVLLLTSYLISSEPLCIGMSTHQWQTTQQMQINARRSGLVMKYSNPSRIPSTACRSDKLACNLYTHNRHKVKSNEGVRSIIEHTWWF